MIESLAIASFKLNFVEERVRVVPAQGLSGEPFAGPGIDLIGAEAREVLAQAKPLLAWLDAREPVRVRSLSFDVARARLLVTVAATPRPRVVRIDPRVDAGASAELVALAAPLLRRLGDVAAVKLVARASQRT
jgi:hypothetical protein